MEIYEAFRAGNVPEDKARAAAAAISERINRTEKDADVSFTTFKSDVKEDFSKLESKFSEKFSDLRSDIRILMWMNGLIILTVVAPALKNLLTG